MFQRFLYTIFLAIDANFKLKCKERGFEDLELGSGWGVFVNESLYQLHLEGHISEPEVRWASSVNKPMTMALVDQHMRFRARRYPSGGNQVYTWLCSHRRRVGDLLSALSHTPERRW